MIAVKQPTNMKDKFGFEFYDDNQIDLYDDLFDPIFAEITDHDNGDGDYFYGCVDPFDNYRDNYEKYNGALPGEHMPIGSCWLEIDNFLNDGDRDHYVLWAVEIRRDRRNCGNGKAMIQDVINWARSRNARSISLYVDNEYNLAAVNVYQYCGFAFDNDLGSQGISGNMILLFDDDNEVKQ